MQIIFFSYTDCLTWGNNPRIAGYISNLQKQGDSSCFCFIRKRPSDKKMPLHGFFPVFTGLAGVFLNLIQAVVFVAGKKADVVYLYGSHPFLWPVWIAGRFAGAKVIFEKTELDSLKKSITLKDFFNRLFYKLDEQILITFKIPLVVISEKLQAYYHTKGLRQIQVTGLFLPDVSTVELSQKKNHTFTIGYLGSFAPKDDLITINNALKLLEVEHLSFRMWWIGHVTEKTKSLLHLNNAVFMGELPYETLLPALSQCDVLLCLRTNDPYNSYGFPSKLGEYFASGKAIICSDNINLPQNFMQGKHVFKVPAENARSLAKQLGYIKNNSGEANAVGLNGQTMAMKIFESAIVLQAWNNFILSVRGLHSQKQSVSAYPDSEK